MLKSELKQIIEDHNARSCGNTVGRELFERIEGNMENPFILVITGVRRSGKSVLLDSLRRKYDGHYLNFDDDRLLSFTVADFQLLYECFLEMYGDRRIFYFDEVQNIEGWERFARRLHDTGYKLIITGSNASLLSRELGTRLTGRHLPFTLFPFSFREYLAFRGIGWNEMGRTTLERTMLKKEFEQYLTHGGFPEYLITGNREYLKTVYDNIVYRDIIVRYRLSGERTMREIVNYSAGNVAREMSFNSLKKTLGLGSSTTVKDYFSYLENAYLAFLTAKYERSLKKQIYARKKLYLVDTGMVTFLGLGSSRDSGRLLENLVFLELKRRSENVYYFRERKECDFVRVGDRMTPHGIIQVCHELTERNRDREISGLLEAAEALGQKKGLILTLDQRDEFEAGGVQISVQPVWEWLLETK